VFTTYVQLYRHITAYTVRKKKYALFTPRNAIIVHSMSTLWWNSAVSAKLSYVMEWYVIIKRVGTAPETRFRYFSVSTMYIAAVELHRTAVISHYARRRSPTFYPHRFYARITLFRCDILAQENKMNTHRAPWQGCGALSVAIILHAYFLVRVECAGLIIYTVRFASVYRDVQ